MLSQISYESFVTVVWEIVIYWSTLRWNRRKIEPKKTVERDTHSSGRFYFNKHWHWGNCTCYSVVIVMVQPPWSVHSGIQATLFHQYSTSSSFKKKKKRDKQRLLVVFTTFTAKEWKESWSKVLKPPSRAVARLCSPCLSGGEEKRAGCSQM